MQNLLFWNFQRCWQLLLFLSTMTESSPIFSFCILKDGSERVWIIDGSFRHYIHNAYAYLAWPSNFPCIHSHNVQCSSPGPSHWCCKSGMCHTPKVTGASKHYHVLAGRVVSLINVADLCFIYGYGLPKLPFPLTYTKAPEVTCNCATKDRG